ncbi:MAG: SMC-Scp complex subunit ScpB [Phycisphaerae bacterium]
MSDQPDQKPEPSEADAEKLEIAATVEAILFASDSPLTASKISRAGELGGERVVREAVDYLNSRYDELGSAFRIEQVAGGYRMMTRPEYHDVLSRLLQNKSEAKLSTAAMETLAVVAYRQPILRADIEAIRGVACGDVLRGLMDKGLVKIVGRAEVLGRPMLYGTTRRFLEVFGLNSLEDLPRVQELRSGAEEQPAQSGSSDMQEPSEAPEESRTDDEQEPHEDGQAEETPTDDAETERAEQA